MNSADLAKRKHAFLNLVYIWIKLFYLDYLGYFIHILFDYKPKLKFHPDSLRNKKILDVTSVIEPKCKHF